MDEEIQEKYRKAGRIAGEARDKAAAVAEAGVELETIAETAETHIRDEGAAPAFPTNTSINKEAAHYTPKKGDDRVLSEGDVLKIDVGAQIDGYIGDTAITVDLGGHDDLTDAVDDALADALEQAAPGVRFGAIGASIQEAIEAYGLQPVRNLGGHGLDQYTQHSGERIPNIATEKQASLEPGNAYAIEPFASQGRGAVVDGAPGNIYKYEGGRVRDRSARQLIGTIKEQYKTLPFTSRWFDLSGRQRLGFKKLEKADVLHHYEILKDPDGLVSQKEHTILVHEDEIEVTTKV